jgi:hypothetical protein
MCTINEWIDLWVWSKENPLDQDARLAMKTTAIDGALMGMGPEARVAEAAGIGNMDNLQSRTASKAKRVRVDLVEGGKLHWRIKKDKRRLEQELNPIAREPQRLVKRQRRQIEWTGELATLVEGDEEEKEEEEKKYGDDEHKGAAAASSIEYSPLIKPFNGQMRYDWTQDPAYLAKAEEGKAICCLTPLEQSTYPYLVHVEHTTNHRLWEMPIPDESTACHSSDSSTRSQDSMPNKGGNWIVNGKIKIMMRTPRLKYDFPFLFPVRRGNTR